MTLGRVIGCKCYMTKLFKKKEVLILWGFFLLFSLLSINTFALCADETYDPETISCTEDPIPVISLAFDDLVTLENAYFQRVDTLEQIKPLIFEAPAVPYDSFQDDAFNLIPEQPLIAGNYILTYDAFDIFGNKKTDKVAFIVSAEVVNVFMVEPKFGVSSKLSYNAIIGTDKISKCKYANTYFSDFNAIGLSQFDEVTNTEDGSLHTIYNFHERPLIGGKSSIWVLCKSDFGDLLSVPKQFNYFEPDATNPNIDVSLSINPITFVENDGLPHTRFIVNSDDRVICTYSDGVTTRYFDNNNPVSFIDPTESFKVHQEHDFHDIVDFDESTQQDYTYDVECENLASLKTKRSITFRIDFLSANKINIESPKNCIGQGANIPINVTTTKLSECYYTITGSEGVVGSSEIPMTSSVLKHTAIVSSLRPDTYQLRILCQGTTDYTEKTVNFLFDTTPPTMDEIKLDPVSNSRSSLSAGFVADGGECGIDYYTYSIADSTTFTPGNLVAGPTKSKSSQATATGLNLVNGSTYYWSVTATSTSGISSSPLTSSGVLITDATKDDYCFNDIQDTQVGETGVDCGGICGVLCPGEICDEGDICKDGYLCEKEDTTVEGVQNVSRCVENKCKNLVQDLPDEDGGINCGLTSTCGKCVGDPCTSNSECNFDISFCDTAAGVCVEKGNTCFNGVLDEDLGETDIDCGSEACGSCRGETCGVGGLCARGLTCNEDDICIEISSIATCGGDTGLACEGEECGGIVQCGPGLLCKKGVCEENTCFDNVFDADETDVDCGGLCAPCADGSTCKINPDCLSGFCGPDGTCIAPTCDDGYKNGGEGDEDCGVVCNNTCDIGRTCLQHEDCVSNYCKEVDGELVCAEAFCDDNIKNGFEGDIDCGGTCSNKCSSGQSCNENEDCESNICNSGVCSEDPNKDTDGDGMPDQFEQEYPDCLNELNPQDGEADCDGEGLTNLQEYLVKDDYGRSSNPTVADTDGDGFNDKREINAGTSPVDPTDHPQSMLVFLIIGFIIVALLGSGGYYYYKNYYSVGRKIDFAEILEKLGFVKKPAAPEIGLRRTAAQLPPGAQGVPPVAKPGIVPPRVSAKETMAGLTKFRELPPDVRARAPGAKMTKEDLARLAQARKIKAGVGKRFEDLQKQKKLAREKLMKEFVSGKKTDSEALKRYKQLVEEQVRKKGSARRTKLDVRQTFELSGRLKRVAGKEAVKEAVSLGVKKKIPGVKEVEVPSKGKVVPSKAEVKLTPAPPKVAEEPKAKGLFEKVGSLFRKEKKDVFESERFAGKEEVDHFERIGKLGEKRRFEKITKLKPAEPSKGIFEKLATKKKPGLEEEDAIGKLDRFKEKDTSKLLGRGEENHFDELSKISKKRKKRI